MTSLELDLWSSEKAEFIVDFDGQMASIVLTGFKIPPKLAEQVWEDESSCLAFFDEILRDLAE